VKSGARWVDGLSPEIPRKTSQQERSFPQIALSRAGKCRAEPQRGRGTTKGQGADRATPCPSGNGNPRFPLLLQKCGRSRSIQGRERPSSGLEDRKETIPDAQKTARRRASKITGSAAAKDACRHGRGASLTASMQSTAHHANQSSTPQASKIDAEGVKLNSRCPGASKGKTNCSASILIRKPFPHGMLCQRV